MSAGAAQAAGTGRHGRTRPGLSEETEHSLSAGLGSVFVSGPDLKKTQHKYSVRLIQLLKTHKEPIQHKHNNGIAIRQQH